MESQEPGSSFERVKYHPHAIEFEARNHGKVMNDAVHKLFHMHPLLIKIIDTPPFQRLHNLKQLGMSYKVYASAKHSRYEHSVGVSHLALEMIKEIAINQPELKITREEILCIAVAGLLHDLGHGPFSHTWEKVMELLNPEAHWQHEKQSVVMFDYMLGNQKYGLEKEFLAWGLSPIKEHRDFIVELINGPLNGSHTDYVTKTPDRHFLFEIVANKRNGIDVDKFDYLQRDMLLCGLPESFCHDRFIKLCRVVNSRVDKGKKEITYALKDYSLVIGLFQDRKSMHDRVYQHHGTKVVEAMVFDALVLADPHIKLKYGPGKSCRPSEAYKYPEAFLKLTDAILEKIATKFRPEVNPAREILERIEFRELYVRLNVTSPRDAVPESEAEIVDEVASYLKDLHDNKSLTPVDLKEKLVVQKIRYDFGMKTENPLKFVSFWDKSNRDFVIRKQPKEVSRLHPEHSHEVTVLFLYKDRDPQKIAQVKSLLEIWSAKTKKKLRTDSVQKSSGSDGSKPDSEDPGYNGSALERAKRKLDMGTEQPDKKAK